MRSSQTTNVVLDDGAETTVERWGDSGPVMLCVHGMTSSRKAWTRFANRYADRFRVVAYDQRGHGDCAHISGPMTLDRGVKDLENVFAAIGGADVLVGHSWGGAVVIRGGLRLPVNAVVAIDPMIVQVPDSWYDEYVEELRESFAVAGSERDQATRKEYSEWHPDDIEGKVHAVHAMTAEPIARLCTDNKDGNWDLRQEIASYDKPLLLAMAGWDGSIVPREVFEAVEQNRPNDVKFEIFHDQDHNFYRTDFHMFALVLDRFLTEQHLEPK